MEKTFRFNSPISSSESESSSSSSFLLKLEVDDMKRDRLARFAALEVADEGDDLKDVLEAGGEAIGLWAALAAIDEDIIVGLPPVRDAMACRAEIKIQSLVLGWRN